MKFWFLFTTILLITTAAFSQKLQKSALIIIAGPSFPTGDFGDSDEQNPNSGLATLGGFLALEYERSLGKDFNFSARLGASMHGINFNYSAPTGSSMRGSTTNWKNANLLVGASYVPTISNRVNFITKLMVGYQYTSSPEVNISISGSFNGSSRQKSASSSSLGALLGIGFNYQVAPNLGLRAVADYGLAHPNFNVSQTSGNIIDNMVTSQSVTLINLGFGIAFAL